VDVQLLASIARGRAPVKRVSTKVSRRYDLLAMGPRTGRLLLVSVALSMLLAAPAAGRLRVLARWNITISGSIRHSWSLPDAAPCHATGSGSVTASFASTHAERITIADNGFGPGDISWDGFFRIRGTITATDGRTRNPPDPGASCDTSVPVPDKRACGSRHFHTGLAIDAPLGTERRGYVLTDNGSFTTPAVNAPEGVEDCERDGFESFAFVGSGGAPASRDLVLPGYPTAARLASRRGRIVIAVSQNRRFVSTAVTVRRVKIVLTRVG
jgi:hypothetical protein